MSPFYNSPALLESLKALAVKAGEATLPYFRNDETVIDRKGDGSPQTMADRASEALIIAGLKALTPAIPVIAEEEAEDGKSPDIAGEDLFWLVDPLDGTREFIKGRADYTVNIGLIRKGKPVLGIVYIPVEQTLYFGGEGIGAWRRKKGESDQKIAVRPYDSQNLVIVASRSHTNPARMQSYLKGMVIRDYVTRGSSLKFCLVAEGTADLYPRFVPTYEWDTAAAHAILLEAGGDIIDYETSRRLAYGKIAKDYRNGHLITASGDVLKALIRKPS